MEKVRLKVVTVPALDPHTYLVHTAFCVSATNAEGKVERAHGWTLRDAIDVFCLWYHVDRNQITLQRPFFQQRIVSDDYQ